MIKSQIENVTECGVLCRSTWNDDPVVAQTRCNAFIYDGVTQICDMGVIGPFGGDFDTWQVVDKQGVHVLTGCLPKSKIIF
jgi:hypothetical protein